MRKLFVFGSIGLITLIANMLVANMAFAKKTFVYCSEASPKLFNPQLAVDGPTLNATSQTIYNNLVEFKHGSTEIVPALAESWQVDKKATTYTFQLRKGVKFHTTDFFTSTRDFKAQDVLFSFNRMRDKEHPFHKVSGGLYQYFDGMGMGKLIKDIRKVDDYKIQIELHKPEAPFLANLAMGFSSILSEEYGEFLAKKNQKDKMDTEPVGTGPFVFKKYVKDNLIRYAAHPQYFGGTSKIDNLVFSITPDPSVRFQKLKAGECHFIAEPSPADILKITSDKKFTVIKTEGLNVGYLAFNTQKKPFDNPLVRQAINQALNRDAYIEAIFLGNAQKAKNPIPPTMWSHNNKIKPYEYNPEEAKKLLVRAGYPNGFETELWTLPVSRPYNPNGKKMGEMMQSDLARVGIKAKLVTYKWAEYLSKAAKGEHQLLQLGWTGDNGDPDNFLGTLLGCEAIENGSNYARWCDKDFQQHIEKAKVTTVHQERVQHYEKAQEIFKTQVPWVAIAHSTVFKAMTKKVKGYKASPFGVESFFELDLD